tara:strand:+ start:1036 stop:1335 length:300 start_codon:yes stop_codon:yes gene_type:complete
MAQTAGISPENCVKLKAPNKYHVILLNDNATPMEFVINVLITIFRKDPETAKDITLEVHEKGRGIAGTYSYEVAEQKCMETITQARSNTYPLDVIIEEE